MLRTRAWLAPTLALVGAACNRPTPEDRSPGVAVRDSAGIEIVESTRPLWSDSDGWRVESAPVLDLSASGAGPNHEFFQVRGMRRLIDGSLAVANGSSNEVRLYSADGQSSYGPPEGFSERFGVRVADFNAIAEGDIDAGRNVLQAPDGTIPISTPCGYAVLEPKNGATAIASLEGETVAVRSPDGRFTWWGLSLSAGFGNAGHPDLVLPPVRTAGIEAPLAVDGSGVVPVVRGSANGGDVAFLFNLERSDANVTVRPHRPVDSARNLLAKADLPLRDGGFEISIPAWKHAVVHLA